MICPINFGDCPDCEYYIEACCQYKEDDKGKYDYDEV